MDIATTMVRFRCPKAMMEIRTPAAQLFNFGEEQEKRIWVPASKIITQPDNESEDLNVCVMPKWLYGKTMLPLYTEVVEEFTHVEKIDTL